MDTNTPTGNGYARPGPDTLTFIDILRILRRQRWWIAGVFSFVLLATVLFTFLQAPVYRAETTLRVEEQQGIDFPVLDVFPELARGVKVETEMEIIRSRQVAEDVVEDLGLQATIESPLRTFRESLFSLIRVDRNAEYSEYRLVLGDHSYELSGPDGRIEGEYGRAVRLGALMLQPHRPQADREGSTVELKLTPFAEVVTALQEKIRVTRPRTEASIVAVSYESTDPALARDVVNSATRHFLSFRNAMEKQRASATVRFLRDQLAALEGQLADAEAALERFREENLLVAAQVQVEEDVKRLAELQARRSALEVERSALAELLSATEAQAPERSSWAQVASFPTFMQNEVISNILEQLTTLETELSRLEGRRKPADPDVRNLQATIRLLETRLGSLAKSYLAALNRQAAGIDETLAQFDEKLEKVPAVEVQYARLSRTTDVLSELYTFLQKRLKEAEVAEAVEIATIQVVDPGVVPVEPVRPRNLLNLLVGGLLGGVLALGVVFLRESLDTRLRTREELIQITGLPVLASVPRIRAANGRRADAAARIEARLVTHHSPRSPAAEAYRALRTNLTFSATGRDKPIKLIAFTSPEPQDGKSTTAANTAIILAEQGHATVLVDCDLRRPMLHRVFAVPRSPGIVEVLMGSATLGQVARRIELPHYAKGTLDLVTAGAAAPNPAELLGSSAMRSFLDEVASYEMVALDTPPLNVVTDAMVVGSLVDGIIIVTRQGTTHRAAVTLACEELGGIRPLVLGTILNDVDPASDGYSYSKAYRQYYERDAE